MNFEKQKLLPNKICWLSKLEKRLWSLVFKTYWFWLKIYWFWLFTGMIEMFEASSFDNGGEYSIRNTIKAICLNSNFLHNKKMSFEIEYTKDFPLSYGGFFLSGRLFISVEHLLSACTFPNCFEIGHHIVWV